jgi:hypothetical protein
MGLKGYRSWVMGQLDSTCKIPTADHPGRQLGVVQRVDQNRAVAAQVENLKKQTMRMRNQEITFKLQGLKLGACNLRVNWIQLAGFSSWILKGKH